MNQALIAFEEIHVIQKNLCNMKKTVNQEKKFKQFQVNFKDLSKEFKAMLKAYKLKTESLSLNDFKDSEFRLENILFDLFLYK